LTKEGPDPGNDEQDLADESLIDLIECYNKHPALQVKKILKKCNQIIRSRDPEIARKAIDDA
jgi:hypothetical protein